MSVVLKGSPYCYGHLDRADLRVACFLTGAVPGFPVGTKFRVRERSGEFVIVFVRTPDGTFTENYLTTRGELLMRNRNTRIEKRSADALALAA